MRALCVSMLLLVALLLPRDAAALENLERLPPDTLWAVAVRDIKGLKAKTESGPLGAAWNHPEAAAFRAAIEKRSKEAASDITEEIGLQPSEIAKELQGFAAVYSTHFRRWTEGDYSKSEWDICLVAEIDPERQERVHEIIRQALSEVAETAKRSAEDFRDTRIYRVEIEQITTDRDLPESLRGLEIAHEVRITIEYAFVGKYLVLAEGPKEPAKKAINALLSPDAPSLGANESFRRLVQQTRAAESDVIAWADVPRLTKIFLDEEGQSGPKPMEQLGLDGFQPALVVWGLSDDAIVGRLAMGVGRDRRGIVEMLYAGGTLRETSARRVPADVLEYVAWTLDLGPAWQRFRAMMRSIEPASDAMIQAWVGTARMSMAVDIEADIIERIEGEHFYYTRTIPVEQRATPTPIPGMEFYTPPVPTSTNTTLFGLSDGTRVVEALEGLFHKLTGEPFQIPIEKREQDGYALWGFKEDAPVMDAMRMFIGLTPAALVMSSSAVDARDAIRRLGGEAGGATLADDPIYQGLRARVASENLRVLAYTSPDAMASLGGDSEEDLISTQFLSGLLSIEPQDLPPASWWKRTLRGKISAYALHADHIYGEEIIGLRR
ncbi:MAG: hypothetical protein KF858_11510 [Candidatus Sumerlaeia bacterium]|nr:hypothetical protein [Candidatus Sumerlaeia bacterium]